MNKKIIIMIFLLLVAIYGFYKYILYKDKIEYETINYEFQSDWVKEVYDVHPNIFKFDSNGICKMTVEQMHTLQNDVGNSINP